MYQEEMIPGMIAMSRKSSVDTITPSASCASLLQTTTTTAPPTSWSRTSSSLLLNTTSCQDSSLEQHPSLQSPQQAISERESREEDSVWGHFLDVERADADLTKHSRVLTAQERHYQQANRILVQPSFQ
jgi:hypothetical protein